MSGPKEKASAKDNDTAAGLRIDRCSAAGAGMGGRQRPRAFALYGARGAIAYRGASCLDRTCMIVPFAAVLANSISLDFA